MMQVSALPVPPLTAEKTALAAELIRDLDATTLHWLSGYMAGAAATAGNMAVLAPLASVPVVPKTAEKLRLTVLYGSQTGNAKRVAEELAAQATAAGLDVRLLRADAYPLHELKKERLLYVVISTHSVGDDVEPPDDSRAFFEFLLGKRAPRLPELSFAVLALGDTSYADFCGIGRQIDERLAELGGRRLLARGEADVDLETVTTPWLETALREASAAQSEAVPAAASLGAVVTPLHSGKSQWTRKNPFPAEVLFNQRIVAQSSDKDVRHIELSLAGSDIHYQPGDALAIWPVQSRGLVAEVLKQLDLDGEQPVEFQGETLPLARWLRERRELTTLTRPFLTAHAARGEHAALNRLLTPEAVKELSAYLYTAQLPDLLIDYPVTWEAAALVAALRPLAPRSYSIASSQSQVDEEVHLTVALVAFEQNAATRRGAATGFLVNLVEGDTVPVYLEPNERFRLPADGTKDVIMIGPGTGVAPFRGFMQKRVTSGASGRNWLFFGDRHLRSDFLYQLEWRQAYKRGELTHLDVAFSRDQEHKVYVQHRIAERGAELWRWLEGGAHIYVCGDADRMAPDVHEALVQLVETHGQRQRDDAEAFIGELLREGRYARDVY